MPAELLSDPSVRALPRREVSAGIETQAGPALAQLGGVFTDSHSRGSFRVVLPSIKPDTIHFPAACARARR